MDTHALAQSDRGGWKAPITAGLERHGFGRDHTGRAAVDRRLHVIRLARLDPLQVQEDDGCMGRGRS